MSSRKAEIVETFCAGWVEGLMSAGKLDEAHVVLEVVVREMLPADWRPGREWYR